MATPVGMTCNTQSRLCSGQFTAATVLVTSKQLSMLMQMQVPCCTACKILLLLHSLECLNPEEVGTSLQLA